MTAMEVRQLAYFIKVVGLRSFTKAAAELRIAQPALGQQVKNLEEELGVTLLIRHSRGVEPTEAGQLLFDRATRILEDLRRAADEIRELQGSTRGAVAVGMTPGISEFLAGSLVERCSRNFPEVTLNLVQDLSARLIERVATEQDLTLALVSSFDLGRVREVTSQPLANERLFLVGSPELMPDRDSPVRFAELSKYRLIMLGTGAMGRSNGLRRTVEQEAERQNVELNIVYEMQSVTAVTELVERKLGVSLLPLGTVARRVAEGKLRALPVRDPEICRELCLAFSTRRHLSPAARAVRSVVTALVSELIEDESAVLRPLQQVTARA
jgi:LysR family transcriptional regulator, nitrogen assimilation regulatory protein